MLNVFDTLVERGFVSNSTDENMRSRLAKPCTVYIGFDPTADSLHIGSLVPIMVLRWLQLFGHKPIVLVGGATGLVGDPSGKSEARKMLTIEQVNHNAESISKQIGNIVRFGSGNTDAKLVNNASWLAEKNWIELLREVGQHFSVNHMLSMESVKGRMKEGISFIEFNYMIMQAMDFAHLFKNEGCTIQMGGQDQWGNMVMGIDLTRRLHGESVAGLTFPLITKGDGTKFGKSEKGNIWLSPELTPVHDFFQFWRNIDDKDVFRFLKLFTMMPMNSIEQSTLVSDINIVKKLLAFEVTKIVHGADKAMSALTDSDKAFSGNDFTGSNIPHDSLEKNSVGSVTLVQLLVKSKLCSSNTQAKDLITGGGVTVKDTVVNDIKRVITTDDVTDNFVIIKVGKKKLFRFDLV